MKNAYRIVKRLVKYVLGGVINSIVGYGAIFFFQYIANFSPYYSNFLGYFLGFFWSFFLNKYFVFTSSNNSSKEFGSFIIVAILAYSVNFLILTLSIRVFAISSFYAQIISGLFYIITSYLLLNYWVFPDKLLPQESS